jgi:hypothetical protein
MILTNTVHQVVVIVMIQQTVETPITPLVVFLAEEEDLEAVALAAVGSYSL